jgi:hypothetical protein
MHIRALLPLTFSLAFLPAVASADSYIESWASLTDISFSVQDLAPTDGKVAYYRIRPDDTNTTDMLVSVEGAYTDERQYSAFLAEDLVLVEDPASFDHAYAGSGPTQVYARSWKYNAAVSGPQQFSAEVRATTFNLVLGAQTSLTISAQALLNVINEGGSADLYSTAGMSLSSGALSQQWSYELSNDGGAAADLSFADSVSISISNTAAGPRLFQLQFWAQADAGPYSRQAILQAVPVPEPSTYALMLLGTSLVWGIARRRRVTPAPSCHPARG